MGSSSLEWIGSRRTNSLFLEAGINNRVTEYLSFEKCKILVQLASSRMKEEPSGAVTQAYEIYLDNTLTAQNHRGNYAKLYSL